MSDEPYACIDHYYRPIDWCRRCFTPMKCWAAGHCRKNAMSTSEASTIDRIMAMLREQARDQADTDEMGYRAAMAILNRAEEIVGLPQTDQVLPSWVASLD